VTDLSRVEQLNEALMEQASLLIERIEEVEKENERLVAATGQLLTERDKLAEVVATLMAREVTNKQGNSNEMLQQVLNTLNTNAISNTRPGIYVVDIGKKPTP
jgi:DNA-directed RNA polymerase